MVHTLTYPSSRENEKVLTASISYMHGIMDGEVIEDEKTGKYSYQDFALK
jgi:hypothetical protein